MARAKREDGAAPLSPAEQLVEVASMEADALFEQLMAANAAPEPGTRPGEVVSKTIDDEGGSLAVPMVAASVQSAGYTTVFDQQSGEPSVVNNNMLQQSLRKLSPMTGKVMYGLRAPVKDGKTVVPFRGSLKCRLHPADAERPLWDEMGFAVCDTDNLRTKHNVTRHMETRHKQEWKAIKEREAEEERAEQKLERRALLSLVSAGRVGGDAA